jgi:hypothetical protein
MMKANQKDLHSTVFIHCSRWITQRRRVLDDPKANKAASKCNAL